MVPGLYQLKMNNNGWLDAKHRGRIGKSKPTGRESLEWGVASTNCGGAKPQRGGGYAMVLMMNPVLFTSERIS